MYRLLYTILLSVLMPFILLRLFWRSLANPEYRQRIPERFGFIAKPTTPVKVWLHSVSVGETMAAKPLIEELINVYGKKAILVSTTTPTGSNTVRHLFGDRVVHNYFPYDLPFIVESYLRRIDPGVFVCMETEIWPNFWHDCAQKNIPVVLANARLSARSTNRYKKIQPFVSKVLNEASLIACRNEQDAAHFLSLGTSENRVKVIGDIKSDISISEVDTNKSWVFKEQWGISRPVFIAASTHEGEDSLILDTYQELKSSIEGLLLVIAPRHPERFDDVSKLIEDYGFGQQRRSAEQPFFSDVEVILGDSMGEMMAWYAAADVVFMGGSLVSTGGHNPLEPLACAVPVISGPHVFNFNETFMRLIDADAAFVAETHEELTEIAKKLLTNEELSTETGEKGRAILDQDKGATDRLVSEVAFLIRC